MIVVNINLAVYMAMKLRRHSGTVRLLAATARKLNRVIAMVSINLAKCTQKERALSRTKSRQYIGIARLRYKAISALSNFLMIAA